MLPKAYDPQATEDRIYRLWEESGAFMADNRSGKEPFTISMPPPNATGQLHVGHAVMLAIEDIFIRFHRMRGREALWVPGTDHAAIATESVVIQKLQEEEGIADPRAALGREKLVERIKQYVETSQGTIRSQMRKMGASCDWSRERYTLDPALNRCVNEVFARMYRDGILYRGHRIVNWDPKMQTTVSDDEIEYVEETAPFYMLQYGPFRIGTARPETKFGDKYVVVHPDDPRYARYADGETFECEWINGRVTATIIKDRAIDPAFGTGCMTITPWHDHTDFDIAGRHGLDKEQIIDFGGKLLPIAGEFAGMTIGDARGKIVEKLDQKGLLVGVEKDYLHRVAANYRGKGTVEPQIKEQWFIDVNKPVVPWKGKKMSLKGVMQDVVRSGDIRIIPERFNKVYFHWIDNLRDWCVSRQIWWGHRIPVWYRGEGGPDDRHVGVQPPSGDGWTQDRDTLDTWFSAALWTWSTLMDPALAGDFSLSLEQILAKSPDYAKFHPTQVMETGYDILFFWVARMILMTTYATGRIPFETVYLHGLIRTREGKKMSKSDPETCIDPLEILPKYGADALRLSMIVGQSPGNDSRLYEEKIAGYRNFVNKLWNAARFVLMKCEEAEMDPSKLEEGSPSTRATPNQCKHGSGRELGTGHGWRQEADTLSLADQALLSALQDLIKDVTEGLEHYRLSEVGERIYSFVWDFFCDWYLELSKGNANVAVLVHVMRSILKLLHPYCPFVTEELWHSLKPHGAGLLISESWPQVNEAQKNQEALCAFDVLIGVVRSIRSIRSDYALDPGKQLEAVVCSKKHADFLESQKDPIIRLARLARLDIGAKPQRIQHAASAFLADLEVHVPLEGVIDFGKEREKLAAEKGRIEQFIEGISAKLGNEGFLMKAPGDVVLNEKAKLADAEGKLKKVRERLAILE